MSISEIERFAADLKSNEALRAEAEKAQPDNSRATPVDRAVAFAASKGYAFTADDVKAYAKAKELADAELDGIAGGKGVAPITEVQGVNTPVKDPGKSEPGERLAEPFKDLFSSSRGR